MATHLIRKPWSDLNRTFGPALNDIAGIEGSPLRFPERPTRFRDTHPLTPLAGPWFSQANRVVNIGREVLEGDFGDAWDRTSRMIPLLNVAYIQALENALQRSSQ